MHVLPFSTSLEKTAFQGTDCTSIRDWLLVGVGTAGSRCWDVQNGLEQSYEENCPTAQEEEIEEQGEEMVAARQKQQIEDQAENMVAARQQQQDIDGHEMVPELKVGVAEE